MTITLDSTTAAAATFTFISLFASHFLLWPLNVHRYVSFAIGVALLLTPAVLAMVRNGDGYYLMLLAVSVLFSMLGALTADRYRIWAESRQRERGNTINGLADE